MKNKKGWINCEDPANLPPAAVDVLFSDGEKVYYGWLETYEPCEEPLWNNNAFNCRDSCPEGIRWWMHLPKPPKDKND